MRKLKAIAVLVTFCILLFEGLKDKIGIYGIHELNSTEQVSSKLVKRISQTLKIQFKIQELYIIIHNLKLVHEDYISRKHFQFGWNSLLFCTNRIQ